MRNKKGFTLFELLVSISIIGILIAISSVSFSAAQKKARDARRLEDMSAVSKAAETYYSLSNYSYPPNSTNPWVIIGTGETVLAVYPKDPKNISPNVYNYQQTASGYYACAGVENPSNGNSSTDTGTVGAGGTGPYFCVKNQQ